MIAAAHDQKISNLRRKMDYLIFAWPDREQYNWSRLWTREQLQPRGSPTLPTAFALRSDLGLDPERRTEVSYKENGKENSDRLRASTESEQPAKTQTTGLCLSDIWLAQNTPAPRRRQRRPLDPRLALFDGELDKWSGLLNSPMAFRWIRYSFIGWCRLASFGLAC